MKALGRRPMKKETYRRAILRLKYCFCKIIKNISNKNSSIKLLKVMGQKLFRKSKKSFMKNLYKKDRFYSLSNPSRI